MSVDSSDHLVTLMSFAISRILTKNVAKYSLSTMCCAVECIACLTTDQSVRLSRVDVSGHVQYISARGIPHTQIVDLQTGSCMEINKIHERIDRIKTAIQFCRNIFQTIKTLNRELDIQFLHKNQMF